VNWLQMQECTFAYYLIGTTCFNRGFTVNNETPHTQLENGNIFVSGDMTVYYERC